ncbi:cupin domain-containing protein [Pseudomonas sp. UBA4194]|uniref:cupin domain-containing protein n=1 Tax=Pseudomonas sp. UBA4194 TaxID=1947317 RepID=UPI0025CF04BE|nr:cupin domain-containing protein [Pseudomonas sp. UBA4194]
MKKTFNPSRSTQPNNINPALSNVDNPLPDHPMQQTEFLNLLAEQGFGTTVVVKREAFATLESHAHQFEAKALVLQGELTIRIADSERTYKAGDIFHLHRDEPHSEVFGAEGVQYLVGRK